jgi:hypothetical membrane protein
MEYTYSSLGSYDSNNNPQWWWLFSVAMTFWGIAMVPIVFYCFRRLASVSKRGATFAAVFMMLGGIGISLIGVFPDVDGKIFDAYAIQNIHKYVALLGTFSYMISFITYGVLFIVQAARDFMAKREATFSYKWFIPPYLVWGGTLAMGVYHMITWESVYAVKKAEAIAAGLPSPGHFSGAFYTRYSFPMWENLLIYSLFFLITWFVLALPGKPPRRESR